jgi:hypothetical protein
MADDKDVRNQEQDSLAGAEGAPEDKAPAPAPEGQPEGEAPKDPEQPKEYMIPKSRFDSALAKERAKAAQAQAELDRLRAGTQQQNTQASLQKAYADRADLREKLAEAQMDGNRDTVKKLSAQIDQLNDAIEETRIREAAASAKQQAVIETQYESALAQLAARYPELDSDQPALYNEAKANEVASIVRGLVPQGVSPAQALKRAARYVMGDAAMSPDIARAQQNQSGARRNTAAAILKQPPSLSGVGADSDAMGAQKGKEVDVMHMSLEQFSKLDEATQKRLRGDEV